ncbi:MAG: hypothetical protein R3E39_02490 [Anaerolineae bacterium]
MTRRIALALIILVVGLGALLYPVAADCQVNGGAGSGGGAGADTIVCDNNPAPPAETVVGGGDGGNDQITIDSSNQTDVAGDGIVTAPNAMNSAGVAGNDTITINGNTSANVSGDLLNAGVNGGNDTIVINGSAGNVYGDVTGQTASGGNDNITVNGTVTGEVAGDLQSAATGASIYTGGDDTITINGTVGSVSGDNLINGLGTSIGGADNITIGSNAQVNGNVSGETGATVGGDDTVTIVAGATITGVISGGNVAGDNDTLIFSGTTTDAAEYNQVQAFVGCNPCAGTVTVGGQTYTFQNFEQLVNLLTLVIPPGTSAPVVITFRKAPDDRINWQEGDWLAPIYNHKGPDRGIFVYWPADELWIPEADLPNGIPASNTKVGCNPSGTMCLYKLAGNGYWQVNVNVTIDGLPQHVTVIFDDLNPTTVTSH